MIVSVFWSFSAWRTGDFFQRLKNRWLAISQGQRDPKQTLLVRVCAEPSIAVRKSEDGPSVRMRERNGKLP